MDVRCPPKTPESFSECFTYVSAYHNVHIVP
jgi:hypothetical protein